METPYQLLPELPTWEYEALKDSIRRLGVLMPVVKDEHGVTIDGHHRERACAELGIANFATMTLYGLTDAEKRDHALLLNLVRRKLSQKQLKQIVAAEIRRTPELSNNWLGRILGVSKNTIAKIRMELEASGEIERLTSFKGKDGKRHPATKVITFSAGDAERARQALDILGDDAPKKNIDLRLAERRAHKKQRRELVRNWKMQTLDNDDLQLHHCDFRDLMTTANLDAGSVDLVLADLPYGSDFNKHIPELLELTFQLLKPGGVFCAYVGMYQLPLLISSSENKLEYQCTGFSSWNGAGSYFEKNGCSLQATPVLIFSKGSWKRRNQWYNHIHRSNSDREKDWHPWQKAVKDISHWLMAFTDAGDLVVDPLAGAFTTAVACSQQNRRFVGCDIVEDNVLCGNKRLAELLAAKHELQKV